MSGLQFLADAIVRAEATGACPAPYGAPAAPAERTAAWTRLAHTLHDASVAATSFAGASAIMQVVNAAVAAPPAAQQPAVAEHNVTESIHKYEAADPAQDVKMAPYAAVPARLPQEVEQARLQAPHAGAAPSQDGVQCL